MGLSLLGGAVIQDQGLVMGEPLHIDDAIADLPAERREPTTS